MLISCGWRRLDVRRLMNPECALEHGGGHNHTLYGSFPPFCSSANLVGRIHERFARSCIQSEWNQLRHYSPFNQIRVIKTNSLKQTGAGRGIVFFLPKKRIFHLVQYYYERKELTAKLLDIFRPPSSPSPDRPRPTTQLELSATRAFRSCTVARDKTRSRSSKSFPCARLRWKTFGADESIAAAAVRIPEPLGASTFFPQESCHFSTRAHKS